MSQPVEPLFAMCNGEVVEIRDTVIVPKEKPHDHRIIHSSEESNWRTPPALYEKLRKAFDFGWDAAADKASNLSYPWCYFGPDHPTPECRDGLTAPWDASFKYFLNPPYSRKQHRLTKDPAMAVENWARKCWEESQRGCTVVGLFPFSPQTEWYTHYVMGHSTDDYAGHWTGHAASEEWRLPHRVSFLRPDGSPASNAGVNSVVIVWRPNPGWVGPWQPAVRYWSYR